MFLPGLQGPTPRNLIKATLLPTNLSTGKLLLAGQHVITDRPPYFFNILFEPPHTVMKNQSVESNSWLHITILPARDSFILLQ